MQAPTRKRPTRRSAVTSSVLLAALGCILLHTLPAPFSSSLSSAPSLLLPVAATLASGSKYTADDWTYLEKFCFDESGQSPATQRNASKEQAGSQGQMHSPARTRVHSSATQASENAGEATAAVSLLQTVSIGRSLLSVDVCVIVSSCVRAGGFLQFTFLQDSAWDNSNTPQMISFYPNDYSGWQHVSRPTALHRTGRMACAEMHSLSKHRPADAPALYLLCSALLCSALLCRCTKTTI